MIYSPNSKNKVVKPAATKKLIERLTQRLFISKSATVAMEQRQSQKTMAELIHDFHQNTRIYDNKENPVQSKWKALARVIPRSPKLLSVMRNRPRNVLSQLEQEQLIGENIKKNTFKANPINKRIFQKSPPISTCQKPEYKPIKCTEFNLRTVARLESRKVKEDNKEHDNAERFVFKARPMPQFKPISIQMRPLKKHLSDVTLKKQVSDTKITGQTVSTDPVAPQTIVPSEPKVLLVAEQLTHSESFKQKDSVAADIEMIQELSMQPEKDQTPIDSETKSNDEQELIPDSVTDLTQTPLNETNDDTIILNETNDDTIEISSEEITFQA
jgi:hypothetical protein